VDRVFGSDADEAFTVYYLSSYIGEVARAGKQVYPLPAYVNCWNGGHDTADQWDSYDRLARLSQGGPVSHMLDLWKAALPISTSSLRTHQAAVGELPHDQPPLHPAG